MKVLKLSELRDDKRKSGIRNESEIKRSGFKDEAKKSILNNV